MDSAKVISVIKTSSRVGDGTKDNPYRTVFQYWTLNGELICKCEKRDDEI